MVNMSVALRKPADSESFPHEAGGVAAGRRHGRGAQTNRGGRFEPIAYEPVDDGWESLGELEALSTEVQEVPARRIITRNESPDIGFDRSINPYRGCEHGCIYCFARPTHAFLGLSPGLDFETKLFAKTNAAQALERELAEPGYQVRTIAIGTNTDPYQPIERRYRIMRRILEVLSAANHPVGIVTKSALVLRDLDILKSMAERGLVKVALSVTTLDRKLARAMEPRASTPDKRLETRATAGRCRRAGVGDGGADHSRPYRHGDGAHPGARGRCRRRERGLCAAQTAARDRRSLHANGCRRIARTAPSACCR